jgi:hypothetical protein
MITIRSRRKVSAPTVSGSEGFPPLAYVRKVRTIGYVRIVLEEIQIYRQPQSVETMDDPGAVLRVEQCLFWRAIRLAQRDGVSQARSVRDELGD